MSQNPSSRSPPSPPTPPPLPPALTEASKVSRFALKVQAAPPGWVYESSNPPPAADLFEPPTGPYFFYGSLMDPKMLKDVLGLDHEPILRPAKIVGYACKLRGQYPAMVDGDTGATVQGVAYDVGSVEDAKRLAEYETKNYRTQACLIQYMDEQEPRDESGRVFMFIGRMSELEEGNFNLETWLKSVGR